MTCYCSIIDIRKEIELLRTSEFYTEEIIKNSSLTQMRDDLALLLYNTHNLHLLGIHEHYQFFFISVHDCTTFSINLIFEFNSRIQNKSM